MAAPSSCSIPHPSPYSSLFATANPRSPPVFSSSFSCSTRPPYCPPLFPHSFLLLIPSSLCSSASLILRQSFFCLLSSNLLPSTSSPVYLPHHAISVSLPLSSPLLWTFSCTFPFVSSQASIPFNFLPSSAQPLPLSSSTFFSPLPPLHLSARLQLAFLLPWQPHANEGLDLWARPSYGVLLPRLLLSFSPQTTSSLLLFSQQHAAAPTQSAPQAEHRRRLGGMKQKPQWEEDELVWELLLCHSRQPEIILISDLLMWQQLGKYTLVGAGALSNQWWSVSISGSSWITLMSLLIWGASTASFSYQNLSSRFESPFRGKVNNKIWALVNTNKFIC